MKYIEWFAVFLIGMALGNYEGAQLTFKDCAIKGEAKMAGGGSIRCGIISVPDGKGDA